MGDKKLSALEQFQKTQPFVNALTDGESIVAVTPKGRKLENSYNKKDGYIRPHAVIKNLDNPSQEVVKNPMTKDQLHTYIANFEDVKIKPQSTKKLTVTYNKKGDLSSANVAKKIKGAIAGVKGGKVVKGQMPVSGRVIESGKVGKDGFAKATVSIPLHANPQINHPLHSGKGKHGFVFSEPTKGERIGDYHVSKEKNKDGGYSVTHIPSGAMVLNANMLRNELGGNDKETAKRAAKKLHNAQIPIPKTFKAVNKLHTTQVSKGQEIGRRVLSSIK